MSAVLTPPVTAAGEAAAPTIDGFQLVIDALEDEVELSRRDFDTRGTDGDRHRDAEMAAIEAAIASTLHLLETGQMLPLSERNEFTLGRSSDGQPIMPDIDLTPYQAYASGVSRLHAVVKRDADRVVVMEKTNARELTPRSFPQPFEVADLVVMDKNFEVLITIYEGAVKFAKDGMMA